jgi:NAD(P)-dependent dehydrogenase (short-subunit alcohol dehydrogenase family)
MYPSMASTTSETTRSAPDTPQPRFQLQPMGASARPVTVLSGATGGIGALVARQLVASGHDLVVLARDRQRGEQLCLELCELAGQPAAGPAGRITWVHCDLSALASVRGAAAELDRCLPRIDRLINNAAMYGPGPSRTVDGLEAHLVVNYLSPFLLTHLLLPALSRAPSARIVNVSGETARIGRIKLADLNRWKRFTVLGAYAQTKLALILFTRALAARLAGSRITVNALHPGPAATGHLSAASPWLRWLWSLVPGPERAARRVTRLALDPALEGVTGRYYLGGVRGPAPFAAYRPRLVAALYARSAELVSLDPEHTLPGHDHA